jgi:hypothetical protein
MRKVAAEQCAQAVQQFERAKEMARADRARRQRLEEHRRGAPARARARLPRSRLQKVSSFPGR